MGFSRADSEQSQMSFLSHNLRLRKIWRHLSILKDFAYAHSGHPLNLFQGSLAHPILKMEKARPQVKPLPLRVHKLIYLVVVSGEMTGAIVHEDWENLTARK